MKKTLLIFSLLFVSSICFSQERCGTDRIEEQMKAKDPTLEEHINKEWQKIQRWISENRPKDDYSNYAFPEIPGFKATGDFETDLINFQLAKEELCKTDPDTYKRLTRIQAPEKKEIKEERKEILKERNKLKK